MEKGEWNCFTMAPGEQSAMTPGILAMHGLYVVHLGIRTPSMLHVLPISVKEAGKYCWTMSAARVTKLLLRVAPTVDGMYIIAFTVKTRQSFVQVNVTLNYLFTLWFLTDIA